MPLVIAYARETAFSPKPERAAPEIRAVAAQVRAHLRARFVDSHAAMAVTNDVFEFRRFQHAEREPHAWQRLVHRCSGDDNVSKFR